MSSNPGMPPGRIVTLNNGAPRADASCVLYWMQSAQRAENNHALEHAVELAGERGLPVMAVFVLTPCFPDASERHYRFMLEGLRDASTRLVRRGIPLAVIPGDPPEEIIRASSKAALVVTDAGHLRILRQWRRRVAAEISCPLIEVETNLVVPVDEASQKEEYGAYTLRPRLHRKIPDFMRNPPAIEVRRPLKKSLFPSLDLDDIPAILARMKISRAVGPAAFQGGQTEARRRLRLFLDTRLERYDTDRNDPSLDGLSGMSPYLHFGHISPVEIALDVMRRGGAGADPYLEELIVRRELAANFVRHNPHYDSIACLPDWARATLDRHRPDPRPYLYSFEDLETARTHDPYWNAAQKEMVLTGKMHGYMRMYWGKKIIEWSATPEEAWAAMIRLNDRYELDGRDPAGYANIAWCFGKHDRPWTERPVFGKVRYMNAAGLKRKFDMEGYLKKITDLAGNS